MSIKGFLFFGAALHLLCMPFVARAAESDSTNGGFRFPLQTVGALKSTFSEHRSGHFHAGIDLSTGGRIGMPVIAVRSGYVYRVRVSGSGYGKAVELLLDNGMIALYGHLDTFSEKIESFARSKQLERESYEIDAFPAPLQIPVVSGEIIGYSGNTGFSFGPHLHFELRRGEVALNPLVTCFPIEEHVSPTFRFVKLTPLSPESEIDGESVSRVFLLKRSRGGETYTASVVPELAGAFLVSVSVFDRTEKADNRLSVYGLKLFLDDSLLFESKFDEIESSRNQEVDLVYDYGLVKKGEVYTFNLCRFEGSKLRLLEGLKPGAGVLETSLWGVSGSHTLRIEASDARGNVSTALLGFVANQRPLVSSVELRKRESSLSVEADVRDPEGDVADVWADYMLGTLNGVFSRITLKPEAPARGSSVPARFSAVLKLPSSLRDENAGELKGVFRVWAKDGEGRTSRSFTKALLGHDVPKDVSVRLDVEHDGDYARILARVSPGFLRPRIGVASGDTSWLKVSEEAGGLYTADYKYRPVVSDAATTFCLVEAENSTIAVASKPLSVRTARKGWEGDLWSSDLGFGLVYEPETFYEDVYVSVEKKERESLSGGLTFASNIFSVGPDDVVFDKAGTVVIRCDGGVPVTDRVGVYRRTSGSNWDFVGAVVDSVKGTVGAAVRAFSDFALIRDEVPPSISRVHPGSGGVSRSATPPTYAIIKDVGSGLEWQGMEILMDGKKVLSEWDPRISRLSLVYTEPLTEGEHTVTFDVRDRAGNESLTQTHFRVAR